MKYYILKRANPKLIDDYIYDFTGKQFEKINSRIDRSLPLILIEKSQNKDNTESYTNLWTLPEGSPILWEKHTKGRRMWDYTGAHNEPLIHLKGEIFTWKQYKNL